MPEVFQMFIGVSIPSEAFMSYLFTIKKTSYKFVSGVKLHQSIVNLNGALDSPEFDLASIYHDKKPVAFAMWLTDA